ETYDLLVTPTCTVAPLPLDAVDLDKPGATVQDLFDHLAPVETFTALFNATGQPALSLPLMQTGSGLPIGIQLIGRHGDEDVLLGLGRDLMEMVDATRRPSVFVA